MDHNYHPKRVENFTNAFLVVTGVILFMALWTVAASAGTLWALAMAISFDRLSSSIARRNG